MPRNKEDKELLEWYSGIQNEQPENGLGLIPSAIDAHQPEPAMEIELKPKEDDEEEKDGDIKDIESWAEIHKAKAFAKVMLNKLDLISGDQPDGKDGEKTSKYRADIKALAEKIVEIVNNVK